MDRSNIDPPKWTVWGKRQLNGWVHFCRWWRKFDLAKSVLFRNLPDWDVCCWCLPVGHGWYYSDDPCHQEVQWVVTAASNHNISPSRQVLNWWKDTFGWLHHHFQQFPWPFTRKKCLAKPWFGWYVYIAGLIFWPQNLCIADFIRYYILFQQYPRFFMINCQLLPAKFAEFQWVKMMDSCPILEQWFCTSYAHPEYHSITGISTANFNSFSFLSLRSVLCSPPSGAGRAPGLHRHGARRRGWASRRRAHLRGADGKLRLAWGFW